MENDIKKQMEDLGYLLSNDIWLSDNQHFPPIKINTFNVCIINHNSVSITSETPKLALIEYFKKVTERNKEIIELSKLSNILYNSIADRLIKDYEKTINVNGLNFDFCYKKSAPCIGQLAYKYTGGTFNNFKWAEFGEHFEEECGLYIYKTIKLNNTRYNVVFGDIDISEDYNTPEEALTNAIEILSQDINKILSFLSVIKNKLSSKVA